MAKYNVNSSYPDGEIGEMVVVGIRAGKIIETSISSAMVQSLQGCTLILLNENSHQINYIAKIN